MLREPFEHLLPACAMIGELFRPPIQSGRESLSESSRKELSNVI